ncbi:MAG: dihydrodipicolinate synthase family protein, partial [Clostridia bacterium]|nr:dihydrodipicolinate synthase family protein [Clostridia bacterium]
MDRLKKYCGVFPAFYACYENDNSVSVPRTKQLARLLVDKGVQGLYVGGSSGECIYLE